MVEANTPQQEKAQNLALRYSYDQLDANHQGIANRVAALVIAYPDIVKLNDPKQQQDFINRIASTQSGKEVADALAALGNDGKAALNFLRRYDATGLIGAAQDTVDTANTIGSLTAAASKGKDVVFSPFSITSAALAEFYNQAKVAWDTTTPEQAREIGAAYASTLQARTTDRAQNGMVGTAFSSPGSFWAVTKALLATVGDLIAEYAPFMAPMMADLFGSSPTRTLAQNLDRQFAAADITSVREEMTKLGQRNGIDFPARANSLTRRSIVQNRAGTDVEVAPPTADNPVPTVPKAPHDAKGNPIAVEPDRTKVLKDANDKAGTAASAETTRIFGDIDTKTELAVAGASAAAVAQGLRGTAEGFASQWSARPAARAEGLTSQVNRLASQIAAVEQAGPKTSILQFARKTPEQLAAMREELAALNEAAVKEGQLAASRSANAGNLARAGQAKVKSSGLIEWAWNLPRNAGRLVGSIPGAVTEKFAELTGRGAVKAAEVAKNLPDVASSVGKAAGTVVTAPVGVVARSLPFAEPVLIGADAVVGQVTGDEHKITTNANAALMVGLGVAGTAFATAVAGLTAVAAAPIVVTGLIVSGTAAAGYKWYADSQQEKELAAQAQAIPAPAAAAPVQAQSAAGLTNAALAAAHANAIDQARMAMAPGRLGAAPSLTGLNLGTGFASVNHTSVGALQRPENTGPLNPTGTGILTSIGQ